MQASDLRRNSSWAVCGQRKETVGSDPLSGSGQAIDQRVQASASLSVGSHTWNTWKLRNGHFGVSPHTYLIRFPKVSPRQNGLQGLLKQIVRPHPQGFRFCRSGVGLENLRSFSRYAEPTFGEPLYQHNGSESQNHLRLKKKTHWPDFTSAKYIRIYGVGTQASVLLKFCG